MLILTRRMNETLMIEDEVNITILGIKGNQVRLGINAPKSIAVHRKEIYLKIKEEGNQRRFDIKNPRNFNLNTNQIIN